MTALEQGYILIKELEEAPKAFNKHKKGHDLLQEYFRGMPTDTLIPLLSNPHPEIHETAVWITSELGKQACNLLPHMVNLFPNGNKFIKYYVLDSIFLCTSNTTLSYYTHLLQSMNDIDAFIRIHAMTLLSNCEPTALQRIHTKLDSFKLQDSKSHKIGLDLLLSEASPTLESIEGFMEHKSPLLRKYGVILAKRKAIDVKQSIHVTQDSDLVEFFDNNPD